MPKSATDIPARTTLALADRQRLSNLVGEHGAADAARILGVHRQTCAALAAGFAAHRSTVALVERRLAEMAAADAETTQDTPDITKNT